MSQTLDLTLSELIALSPSTSTVSSDSWDPYTPEDAERDYRQNAYHILKETLPELLASSLSLEKVYQMPLQCQQNWVLFECGHDKLVDEEKVTCLDYTIYGFCCCTEEDYGRLYYELGQRCGECRRGRLSVREERGRTRERF